MKSKPTSTDNFWSDFQQVLNKRELREPTGKVWVSFSEVQEKSGMAPTTVSARMCALAREGYYERFEGTQERNGSVSRAVWFRRTKKPLPKKGGAK